MSIQTRWILCALSCALAACGEAPRPVPAEWAQREAVAGQPLPVPTVWLNGDPEARYTHNIKLPDSVPKPVPFDFKAAERKAWWPGSESVGIQYLRHLCATEAGEWVFKKVDAQEAIYQARPVYQLPPHTDFSQVEAPSATWSGPAWEYRNDQRFAGAFLLGGPLLYDVVEEPKRSLTYQEKIREAYVQIRQPASSGKTEFEPKTVSGISKPTAKFGATWREAVHANDRQLGIHGIETIIYELATADVLAVRRNFYLLHLSSQKLPRGCGRLTWSRVFHERPGDVARFSVPTLGQPTSYEKPRAPQSTLKANDLSN